MGATGDGPRWTRRQFVKTSVAAGAVGAAAASGGAVFVSLSRPGERPPRFKYWGVKRLEGSKAPRGIPLVPVRTNERGELLGRPDHLEWYRYCGRNNAPGAHPDFVSDNVFRYHVNDQTLASSRAEGITSWWEERLGQPARLEHFTETLRGAPVLWRSEGHERTNPLPVLLVRVPIDDHPVDLAQRFFPDGVMGIFATCAHLCLTPTWRASAVGFGEGHWDDVTCHGHGSWYSVRELAEYEFPPTG